MGVHPWPGIDPASAYMTMTGGAWAAPMHAAGAALNALGAQVQATVAVSEVNDTIVGESWSGQGRISAAASVTTLNTDQTTFGLLSQLKSEILHAAGELHTTTVPQMVTHIQADANRGEWGVDNAINPLVLGALTPRLIDLDGEYFGFMWPNNASAGLRYGAGLDALGAALSSLSALPSLAGGSVAAPAMAAADVASNSGMSMMSAVMSATGQAATSAISPATSGASQAGSLSGQSSLSSPNTSSSTSGVSPLAAVQSQAPVAPSMPQSAPPALGMFAPPAAAAALTPSSPAMPTSPPVQTMAPSAAPGVTNFAKPAEPFSPPPPPSGGQAAGLKPGMLNASALRGPVGTAPASTALLTKPLTTASSLATEPLAYAVPNHPLPPAPPTPPTPPLLSPGSTAQSLAPPRQPQQAPPPPSHTPPPQQQQPPEQPQPQPPAHPDPQPQPNPNAGAAPNQGVQNLSGNLKESPGAQALSVNNAQDVHSIIDPLPPGRNEGVKTLPTPEAIRGLFDQLIQNASPVSPPTTYPGEEMQLDDGTKIRYRDTSGWGGPTIDITYPDGSKVAVHLPDKPAPSEPAPAHAPAQAPAQEPAAQTPAPETHEPAHGDSGHPSIHGDPPPPGFWATIGGIVLGGLAVLGEIGGALE